jgi:glycine/D-amino acid oxidase-like deaminating enzyme
MSRQNVVVDKNTWIAVLKCLAPHPIRRFLLGEHEAHFDFFHIDWFKSLSDPFFLRWASNFTLTSFWPPKDYSERQKNMLQFTDFAVQDMVNMLEDRSDTIGRIAGYNPRGSLAVSYENPSKPPGTQSANNLEPNRHLFATEEVLKEEPSLSMQTRQPTSAKFEYESKAASSGRFTKELARRCEDLENASFYYNTKVEAMKTVNQSGARLPRIASIHTNKGIITVPENAHIVVAAGAWTPQVLSLIDVYAPVYPLKGYAMSISASAILKSNPSLTNIDLPSRIVSDKYMYTTRLGDEIRITSIGEFSEWNSNPTPDVDVEFRREAGRQFPQLKQFLAGATTYCGHRPFVSDGLLLLGKLNTHHNLYVSCGPGSNGWKLAFGSGEVIARLVSGQTREEIREELGFDLDGFSPIRRALYAPFFAKLCRARWDL